MAKRSRRKQKNKKRLKRRISSIKPVQKPDLLVNNLAQSQDETVPLTYPPQLLKADLVKTLIITVFIILSQLTLYWYDQKYGLSHLGNVFSQLQFF